MTKLALLDGVRILSFTQFLLGPAAAHYLAEMGADVVKIEGRAGAWERRWSGGNAYVEGESVFFMATHRGVRSASIDLKSEAGRAAALRLVERADVLVENFRPGVMDRLGLGYEVAKERNPQLIYASASGYGRTGPYKEWPGQDLLIQAMSGLASISGPKQSGPIPMGCAVVDQHGAALLAMGILGALVRRERAGVGEYVQVSMMHAAMDLQQEALAAYWNGGEVRRPESGLASAFHHAPYGVYETVDGHVVLSIQPLSMVREALGALPGLEDVDDADDLLARKDEIYRSVAKILKEGRTEEWLAKLQAAGVWCAQVNDYASMEGDPVVRSVEFSVETEHWSGRKVRFVGHPVRYGSWDGMEYASGRTPGLGEHTAEVLREVGLTEQQIQTVRDEDGGGA